MNFISFQSLQRDILAWERVLPEFDIIIGIPRSGLLVASLIALRRNLRYVDLLAFIKDPEQAIQESVVRRINPLVTKPPGRRVLIVDDSAGASCGTLQHYRDQLTKHSSYEISFGVVYAQATNPRLDYHYRTLQKPRVFEWNFLRHPIMKHTLFDFDGVLCQDWDGHEQVNDDVYKKHVQHASPLYLPCVPILGVVTGRLEPYREMSTNWLVQHGVNYQHLHMYQAAIPQDRRQANDVAIRKAAVYLEHKQAGLFIESSQKQAEKIFQITRKPVLCATTMELYKA